MLTAEAIIRLLELEPLDQEGGYFRRSFASRQEIACAQLGPGYPAEGSRPVGTAIYFLVTAEDFSAMHRLPGPEIWCYHLGDPLEMLLLHPGGRGEIRLLGPQLDAGQAVQLVVPGGSWQGSWQGSRPAAEASVHGYTLVSALMMPGFDFSDFELGAEQTLRAAYPEWAEAIRRRVR